MLKSDKGSVRAENYRPITLINTKILNKVLANLVEWYVKGMILHEQVRFIPRM